MKKAAIVLLLTIILFPFFASQKAFAYSVVNRAELGLDEKLADQTTAQYLEPKKILVSQITTKSDDLAQNTDLWIKSLYYYSITRLNFPDIPYNYLVTREGFVYKARAGYEGLVPELKDPEGAILIGYMSNSADIPVAAQKALADLISDLSAKFAIKKDGVHTVDLTIAAKTDPEKEPSKLKYVDSTSLTANSLQGVYSSARYSSTRVDPAYVTQIKDIVLPTEIKADEKAEVKFHLVNMNDFPWFTDTTFLYVTTSNGKKTDMFVNSEWDSMTRATHVEGKTILPGEEYEVKFIVKAGLVTSDSTAQDFKLVFDPNIKVTGSEFAVKFKTTKGNFDLLRVVLPADYNYTNIRNCASFDCTPVSKASQGEIYPKYEEQSGWYKIRYDDEQYGWISGQYVKLIQQ